jgi:hypothetical protein
MENVMAQADIREELRSAAVEPLLPIEKKLIGWSLTIGLVLLVALALLNHYAPVTFH